jgi:CheY-like chemotaxis protein
MAARKVLHVDDDERVLRTVARFLEGQGLLVISTTSPFIAPLIKQESPHVIVMDVEMPLLPGDRIAAILRGNDYGAIPVVFFSGRPHDELRAIVEKTPCSSFVHKESGLPSLLERIKTVALP